MSNEYKGLTAHSAEYFGDARDHWWHEDYLRFIAARWDPASIRRVLDVGCGVGHWGRLLSRVLPVEIDLTGIDREARWVGEATKKAADTPLAGRARYVVSGVEKMPFEAGAFDLVTCQTVLIHLRDPAAGLAEMTRVLRPGGLVVVAEPTHILDPTLLDALALDDDIEVMTSLLRFQLACQRGKRALGEGYDLLGEQLPALLHGAGLVDVSIRVNDRAAPMFPPYASPSEKALAEEVAEGVQRGMWMWPRTDTLRYFIAGGGAEADFDALWAAGLAQQRRVTDAIVAGTYSRAGGTVFYLAWGRKPE